LPTDSGCQGARGTLRQGEVGSGVEGPHRGGGQQAFLLRLPLQARAEAASGAGRPSMLGSLVKRAGAAVTGDPDYAFGDITKSAASKVGDGAAAAVVGVVNAAGTYRFGDVSRAVAGGVSEAGVVVGGTTVSFFAGFLQQNEAEAGGAEGALASPREQRLGPDAEVNVATIWIEFFGQCFEEGAAALRSGELRPEDVLDREVFFFIGLPARGLLSACLRTLDAPPSAGGGSAAMRLSSGAHR
jgi:hypothetical protein